MTLDELNEIRKKVWAMLGRQEYTKPFAETPKHVLKNKKRRSANAEERKGTGLSQ